MNALQRISRQLHAWVVALSVTFTACGAKDPPQIRSEKLFQKYANAPIGESIGPVSRSLARHTVFIPIQRPPDVRSGETNFKVGTGTTTFKVGMDKEGHPWVYVYTD